MTEYETERDVALIKTLDRIARALEGINNTLGAMDKRQQEEVDRREAARELRAENAHLGSEGE